MKAGFHLASGPHGNTTAIGEDMVVDDPSSDSFAEVTVPQGWITGDGVHTWNLWSSDYELQSGSPSCEFEPDRASQPRLDTRHS